MPKRLELLKQLVALAVRVAVLVNPETQFGPMALPDSQRAARALGLQLKTFEVYAGDGFGRDVRADSRITFGSSDDHS